MWKYLAVLGAMLLLVILIVNAEAACREVVSNGVTVYKCDRPKREKVKEDSSKVERWGGNRSRNVGYGKVRSWKGM